MVVLGIKVSLLVLRLFFINSRLLDDSLNASVKKPAMKSVTTKQSVATNKSVSDQRQKRKNKYFILICHFCGVQGHI